MKIWLNWDCGEECNKRDDCCGSRLRWIGAEEGRDGIPRIDLEEIAMLVFDGKKVTIKESDY